MTQPVQQLPRNKGILPLLFDYTYQQGAREILEIYSQDNVIKNTEFLSKSFQMILDASFHGDVMTAIDSTPGTIDIARLCDQQSSMYYFTLGRDGNGKFKPMLTIGRSEILSDYRLGLIYILSNIGRNKQRKLGFSKYCESVGIPDSEDLRNTLKNAVNLYKFTYPETYWIYCAISAIEANTREGVTQIPRAMSREDRGVVVEAVDVNGVMKYYLKKSLIVIDNNSSVKEGRR